MDTPHSTRTDSQSSLLRLGLENLAYIKSVIEQDQIIYAIFAADGTEIGRSEDAEVALAALRQQGLEGLRVH